MVIDAMEAAGDELVALAGDEFVFLMHDRLRGDEAKAREIRSRVEAAK